MKIFEDEIKNLVNAQAIDGIKFVSVSKPSEFHFKFTCEGLPAICNWSEYERNQLAQELNEALAPVIEKYRNKFAGSVSRTMSAYARDDA